MTPTNSTPSEDENLHKICDAFNVMSPEEPTPSEELKGCPFCGGKIVEEPIGLAGIRYRITHTPDCFLLQVSIAYVPGSLANKWNTRATSSEPAHIWTAEELIQHHNNLAGILSTTAFYQHLADAINTKNQSDK